MNAGEAVGRPAEAVYGTELAALSEIQAQEQRWERALGVAKLMLAAATLVGAGLLIHSLSGLAMMAVPAAAFFVLAVRQEQLIGKIRTRNRAMAFYNRGVARLNHAWAGSGTRGERFLDATHPYARDLDIFGDASLFEYLSLARTRSGEETLAKWLLSAAPPSEIEARQAAARELAGKLKFREAVYSAGETVREGVAPEALAAWGERDAILSATGTRWATTCLALLWVGSIGAWAVGKTPLPLLLMSLLNFAYAHRLHARLDRAAGGIEKAAGDLRLLSAVLALVEAEKFGAPRLIELQAGLQRGRVVPSVAIRKLARAAELIESRHSLFARPLDLVTFWSAQVIFAAERWQRKRGAAIRGWLSAVGEVEALASLAGMAFEHPAYAWPDFVVEGPVFAGEEIAHPLLKQDAVTNDFALDGSRQLTILSGPNMAGKSTFIRAMGVNAVLAQAGAPVRARRLQMSPLQVAASICILDSLSGGVSRFYAEIRRLKMIAALAQESTAVFFLLDELLSGTNSHDRFAGTQFILRTLVDRHAIGVVSTHDLALTKIADTMEGRAFNAHFEDRLEGDVLSFDYKLKPGIVQTSNALKLMRAIGLGVSE